MQFQLKHLLIAITIIAATLAITPVLTIFLFALLLLLLCVDAIVPKRRLLNDEIRQNNEHQILPPKLGLGICCALFLFSISLPIFQELVYLSIKWNLQLWLIPQLLCFIISLAILSFVNFDSHDRFEYRIIVTILYIVFIPVTLIGVLIWRIF